jgi:hypothetical protein
MELSMNYYHKSGRSIISLNGSLLKGFLLLFTLIAVFLFSVFIFQGSRFGSSSPGESHYCSQACDLDRISFLGGKWFLLGFDFPWNNYSQDFGKNDLNVHGQYTDINYQFDDLSNYGTHVTRWFMFNDFSQNPLLDKRGDVVGLSPDIYHSLDDALAIARAHHIYLILDLIDGPTLLKKSNGDALLRSKIFTDPAVRQSFFEKVVKPLLQRYGSDSTILAWSPINEPDYETIGVDISSDNVGIPYQMMKDFMRQFTQYVHTNTRQMVTIENGPLHFTHFWTGLGFDFYSPHYYDWMSSSWSDSDPMQTPAAYFRLDKPIVLGELPSAGSKYSVAQMLKALYKNGYAGALFWSKNASDQFSNYGGTKAVLKQWADVHQKEVNIHLNQ